MKRTTLLLKSLLLAVGLLAGGSAYSQGYYKVWENAFET